jgi:hypothetical protein
MNKYSLLLRLLAVVAAALGLVSCDQRSGGPAEAPPQALAPTAAPESPAAQMPPAPNVEPPIDIAQPNGSAASNPSSTGLLPASEKVDLAVYGNAQRLVQIARSFAPMTNPAALTNRPNREMEDR